MTKLTIVGNIHAKLDQIDLIKAEMQKVMCEEGGIQCDMHSGNGNPAHFMFYANYALREPGQADTNADDLAVYMEALDDAVSEFTLIEMTYIG